MRSAPQGRPIFLNGKFYQGDLNGVHRVADCLIRAIDEVLASQPLESRPRIEVLLPRGCSPPADFAVVKATYVRGGRSQVWEQTVLPWAAKQGVLVSLCNLGPVFHRRHVVMIHDAQCWLPEKSYPLLQRWAHRLITPLIGRTSKRVVTPSHSARQMLELTRTVRPDSARVIYNGADHATHNSATTESLSPLQLRPRGYILVFGSTKKYKNLSVLSRAFPGGSVAGKPIVIVGGDNDLSGMKEAIKVGPVNDSVLRELYENAFCLLFPSQTEGFGLPPLEAMRLGCPVIASPAGAIPEVCADAVLYAGVDDPDSWERAVEVLSTNPSIRERKVSEGLIRSQSFKWTSSARQLLDEIMALT